MRYRGGARGGPTSFTTTRLIPSMAALIGSARPGQAWTTAAKSWGSGGQVCPQVCPIFAVDLGAGLPPVYIGFDSGPKTGVAVR